MILLTGATGYIASHTWVELISKSYQVIGIDNLCNSSSMVLDRIKRLTNIEPIFHEIDICKPNLNEIFKQYKIDAVIHFAALKAVGQSVSEPLNYYQNNLIA